MLTTTEADAALAAMPRYWMRQQGTPLYEAMWAYLDGKPLGSAEIGLIREYLIGVINAPLWAGRLIHELRWKARKIDTPSSITIWLDLANQAGIDPI